MHLPAAAPAAAVVFGASFGAVVHTAPAGPAVALMLASLAASGVAFAAHRPRALLAAVSAVFFSASWALAVRATADALRPPLRASLEPALGAGPVVLEGRLRSDASVTARGVVLGLDLTRWEWNGQASPAAGGVRLTVAGTPGLDQIDRWRAGRTIRLPVLLRAPGRYRDPGVPDGRLALARQGVALVGSVKSGALVEVLARGSLAAEAGAGIRAAARAAIRRHVGPHDPQSAAIVTAILIGDRAGLDDEVQRRLQEAGTYHVIAISGGNIAILAGLLLGGLRLAGAGHRTSGMAAMAALAGYAALVGGSASVVRATVMAIIYLLARQADYRGAPLNALAVTCALILLAAPNQAADVAFWLTFGATLGIMVGAGLAGPALPRRWWLRAPAALLLASVAAELALFPVGARTFARVTFAGLALNFAAIPMMGLAQTAGMLTVAASHAWPAAADVFGLAAHLGAFGLVRSAALVEVAPWLTYRLPPPHWLAMAGYYAGWAVWIAAGSRAARAATGRRLGVRRAAGVVVAACGAWILVEPVTLILPGVSGRLRVTALDVGHGDAVLLQLPDRRSVLVDAGGLLGGGSFDIGGRVVAPALWSLGTRRLDLIVLTHGDPDHAGGMASVVRDFRPREIWEAVPVPGLTVTDALRRQAAEAGIRWLERRAGDVVDLGEVTLRVHHPPAPDWERRRVRNDDSMVVELLYGCVSVVLSGDIGIDVERSIGPEFAPSALRVLKVPHHGSSTSSSREFVSALKPRVALLSAGITTRVSDEVLRRYREIGAAVYRTDLHGAVTFDTDGRRATVRTFTGARAEFTQ